MSHSSEREPATSVGTLDGKMLALLAKLQATRGLATGHGVRLLELAKSKSSRRYCRTIRDGVNTTEIEDASKLSELWRHREDDAALRWLSQHATASRLAALIGSGRLLDFSTCTSIVLLGVEVFLTLGRGSEAVQLIGSIANTPKVKYTDADLFGDAVARQMLAALDHRILNVTAMKALSAYLGGAFYLTHMKRDDITRIRSRIVSQSENAKD